MKRIYFITIVAVAVVAYIIVARCHFFDPPSYHERPLFWWMFALTIPLLCMYKWGAVIWYNLCFVSPVKYLRYIGLRGRKRLFFIGAFVGILIIHLSLMQFLLLQHGHTIFSSGYLKDDLIFFLVPLLVYLRWLYHRPDLSVSNRFLGSLVSGVVRFVSNYFPNKEHIPKVVETAAMLPYEDAGSNRIRIQHILLLCFSKTTGSYMIDVKGTQIFITDTRTVLDSWPAGRWFVEISRGVYINMWYVEGWDELHTKYLAIHDTLIDMPRNIGAQNIPLKQLLKVSYKCRHKVVQHFEERSRLNMEGWDDYYYL